MNLHAYRVKEIRYTLQGEGAQAGRAALLCRFAGCDRKCPFCDTDFNGTDGENGGVYNSPLELASRLKALWIGNPPARPYVVFTGGEPTLQLDAALIDACHQLGFECGIETHGGHEVPPGLDWICVSPKAWPLAQTAGSELKLVYPGCGLDLEQFESLNFQYFYLQPEDGPQLSEHRRAAAELCLARPQWRLSLQQHKIIGIP